MIKMIATDLDCTLLRTDLTISEHTKSVLRRCREAGIKVIYATARESSAAEFVPSELFDGRVLMNGALGFDGNAGVYHRLVPMDLARNLLLACAERGLCISAQCSGMNYSNFDLSEKWSEVYNFKITDFRTHNIPAEKLYMLVESESDIEFIRNHIPQGLYLTVSRDNLAQVMHTEATKSLAISAVAAHWGILPKEIAAFGDDLNDIDMLKFCGTGVAMGNALPEVKAVADHVCGTNDEDGLANWLLENVL